MGALARALKNDPEVPLDLAALEMARIECPQISPELYLQMLDQFAAAIGDRMEQSRRPFVDEANRYLFEELGFKGNQDDYYNPRNSCLNHVLDLRLGIPITLSLIYMEVARRLGEPVYGIGLPGHFLVRYGTVGPPLFLDPFRAGSRMTEADCREMALQTAGIDLATDPALLKPVSKAYLLTRMLNNLRGAYIRLREFAKAVHVLDILIDASPATAEYYRARAIARLEIRHVMKAYIDFNAYLQREPDASDRVEITKQMEAIQRWLSTLN